MTRKFLSTSAMRRSWSSGIMANLEALQTLDYFWEPIYPLFQGNIKKTKPSITIKRSVWRGLSYIYIYLLWLRQCQNIVLLFHLVYGFGALKSVRTLENNLGKVLHCKILYHYYLKSEMSLNFAAIID